jgi:hypothetical protein
MNTYYSMESVRDQIIAAKYTCRIDIDMHSDWNKYPCKIEEQCEAMQRKSCRGYVEIAINKLHCAVSLIEIIFFRPKKLALIRTDNKQIQKLIAFKIIDEKKLVLIL